MLPHKKAAWIDANDLVVCKKWTRRIQNLKTRTFPVPISAMPKMVVDCIDP